MHYEDVKLTAGDTLSQLAVAYGYPAKDWTKIWNDGRNSLLKAKRAKPEKLQAGDLLMVPVPWKIISKKWVEVPTPAGAAAASKRYRLDVKRDGQQGSRIQWVQTVFADNQPQFPPSSYSVDLPTDDDLPFYWTESELKLHPDYHKDFTDSPWRFAPKDRSTAWRAVLSLACVLDKRVTVFESIVWGVNFGKTGQNAKYGPRAATQTEINGQINLLKHGKGRTKTFHDGGWTFRKTG